jgi:hypothetical protein
MGCSACGAKAFVHTSNFRVANQRVAQITSGPCEYTVPMLEDFHRKLIWFKNRALYRKHNIAPAKMNRYIGIVLSSLNVPNRCTHQVMLNEISDVVDLIVTVQQEQNV